MANTWAAIGRAQPHKYAGEILQNKMALEQNERQGLLAQSKLAMDTETIEKMRRQNALEVEAQQKAQTLHPIEEFHGYFRKGAESSNYKMVMDWAKQRGLINTDAGGLGAIREGDIPQVMEFMQNPMTMKNITRNVISDIDADIAGINSQLGEGDKKKDPNPKQQEALAQLNQERLSALSVNANLVNHLKQQEQAEIAAKAAQEKETRDIAAAKLKADALVKSQELQRKNVLEAARIRSSGAGEKPTKKEKKLIDLKADFKYNLSQYNSATRGVGQYIPDENKEKVAKESFDRMEVLAKEYKNSGGDPADLGIDVEPQKKTSTELPEMPPAKDHKGKTIRDTQTNKRYTSNGKAWVEIK